MDHNLDVKLAIEESLEDLVGYEDTCVVRLPEAPLPVIIRTMYRKVASDFWFAREMYPDG